MKSNKYESTNNAHQGQQTRQMSNNNNQTSASPAITAGNCFAKFLVLDSVAGSIIGKNGAVISQIEKEFNCNLRLSNNGAYFPGSRQRICLIAGDYENVHSALSSILMKIKENIFPSKGAKENYFKQSQESMTSSESNNMPPQTSATTEAVFEPSERFTFTMVIPLSSVSVIIGKKGENIKNLSQATNTKLIFTDNSIAHSERLINITGNGKSLLSAASKIMKITQTDPSKKFSWNLDYRIKNPYETITDNGTSKSKQNPSSKTNMSFNPYNGINMPVLRHNCEIKFEIPDSAVGTIIGKQGLSLSGISRRSGAKISISQKGDVVPGTNCRHVHLRGQLTSIHQAHALLIQQYMNFTETHDSYYDVNNVQNNKNMAARNNYNNNLYNTTN